MENEQETKQTGKKQIQRKEINRNHSASLDINE
jgi:hypothetical protein